jgi:hypothetical protein
MGPSVVSMDARTQGPSAWSADIGITVLSFFQLCFAIVFPFSVNFYGRTTSKIPLKFILFLHVEVSVTVSIFFSFTVCFSKIQVHGHAVNGWEAFWISTAFE